MRQILIFLLSVCSLFAAAQPSITDTTKLSVFDRTNAWVTTGALLKAYCASGGGSGDLVNGGQSTGATVSYGTTDAQAAAIVTNSVERLSITGGASTGGAATLTNVTANTNTVQDVLTVRSNSTGAAAAGFGARQLFQIESSTTDNQDAGGVGAIWTTATHASRTSANVFYGVNNAGSLGEFARFEGATAPVLKIASAVGTAGTTTFGNAGITSGVAFQIGGGSQVLTLSSTSGNVSGGIQLTSTNTTSARGVSITGAAYTATGLAKGELYFPSTYTVASGSGTLTYITLGGTLDITGSASGQIRGFYDKTITTNLVSSYRSLDIEVNHANAKGIYQSGSSTTNNIVGKTTHGSTTAPTALLMLAAGTATANTAPLKLTSGTNLTTPENGAVEYDGTNYFVTSGGTRYTLAKVLTGSSTLDFGATAPGAASNLTVTVTGAAAGDVVSVGVDYATVAVANGSFTGYVSGTDTVTIRYTNNDLTTAYNPASATFKVTVTKF